MTLSSNVLSNDIYLFVICLFSGLLAVAAATDVARYIIPNRIVLALAGLYPAYVLASPIGVDWTGALLVGGGVLGVGIVVFGFGFAGGGDVKLAAVTALWAGPSYGFEFLVVTALTGGALALILSSDFRFSLVQAAERAGAPVMRDMLLGCELPYGLAIAAGGLAVTARLLGA